MMLLPRLHQWGGSGKLLYTEIATNQQNVKVSPDMDKMKNIDLEFLHTLHIEKIRTQNERAELVKKKLAFITVFFGIGSVNFGFGVEDLFWLLYFVPLITIWALSRNPVILTFSHHARQIRSTLKTVHL
jgi:hypothetical protein